MNTPQTKDAIRKELLQVDDQYQAVLALRNAEPDRERWLRLDHEQRKLFHQRLALLQALTMVSDIGAYTDEQKMGE